MVVPGSGFELPDTYFRIGFGTEPAELRTGLGGVPGVPAPADAPDEKG